MYIEIDDLNISYDIKGNGKTVLFLHGWGCDKSIWDSVIRTMKDDYKCVTIDLPGFGETKIDRPYLLDEVSNLLYKLLLALKIKNPIIVAHSYGGRIAIKYATMYKVDRLILVDSAGIRHKKKKREGIYKFFKRFNIKLNIGSNDYKKATPNLREMLVDAVNCDLTPILYKIKCPTLLIWGDNDKDVLYSDIKVMNENIKDSGIVVIKNTGHFPFIDNYLYFIKVLYYFLECDISD